MRLQVAGLHAGVAEEAEKTERPDSSRCCLACCGLRGDSAGFADGREPRRRASWRSRPPRDRGWVYDRPVACGAGLALVAHEQMLEHAVKRGVLLAVELRVFKKRNIPGSASLLDSAERANRIAL